MLYVQIVTILGNLFLFYNNIFSLSCNGGSSNDCIDCDSNNHRTLASG